MATLTITHIDEPAVLDELAAIAESNGATDLSTRAGQTTMTFDTEAEARTVAAPLAMARTVTRLQIEPAPSDTGG